MVTTVDIDKARKIAASVPDPELPFLTLEDLGILRDVVLENNVVVAKLTPTYIGCPAVAVIEQDVQRALNDAGFSARILRVESPAWSTSWITEKGLEKLKSNGIAPPEPTLANTLNSDSIKLFAARTVVCPRCASTQTEKLSEFGSTPCKAQYRCTSCFEPFDHFKCH